MIKIIERKIKEAEQYTDITGLCLTLDKELCNAFINILSDYKRVLKENEYMHNELNKQQTTINKYAKENEELKEDRKNNNEMIALAQNKILNYMRGYEDGKKHKMTAVAQGVENQQYYIIQKQMEKYEEHIKKLQKENTELKEENEADYTTVYLKRGL